MKKYLKLAGFIGIIFASCKQSTLSLSHPIVSGYYYNLDNTQAPLLTLGSDQGSKWQYKITSSNLPSDAATGTDQSATLSSSNCSGKLCTAVGSYKNNSGGYAPLLAVSKNGGETWDYVNFANNLPADAMTGADQIAVFISTFCNGQLCIAAGQYKNNTGGTFPWLTVSNNEGASWSNQITSALMPSDAALDSTQQTEFLDTSCNLFVCTAVGSYTSTNGGAFPFVVTSAMNTILSIDRAKNWSYKITSSNLPADALTTGAHRGYLYGTSCTIQVCTAVGYYQNTLSAPSPFLAISNDNGQHWSYPLTSNDLPADSATGGAQQIFLYGTSCSDSTCTTSGFYKKQGGGYFPLLLTANGIGQSWSAQMTSSNLPNDALTTNAQNSVLYKTSCSGNTCIATGYYKNNTDGFFPLIATSSNGGMTWTYTLTSTGLPSNAKEGVDQFSQLIVANCQGDLCLAGGSYKASNDGTFPILYVSTNGGATWTTQIDSTNAPSDAATGSTQYGTFCDELCTFS